MSARASIDVLRGWIAHVQLEAQEAVARREAEKESFAAAAAARQQLSAQQAKPGTSSTSRRSTVKGNMSWMLPARETCDRLLVDKHSVVKFQRRVWQRRLRIVVRAWRSAVKDRRRLPRLTRPVATREIVDFQRRAGRRRLRTVMRAWRTYSSMKATARRDDESKRKVVLFRRRVWRRRLRFMVMVWRSSATFSRRRRREARIRANHILLAKYAGRALGHWSRYASRAVAARRSFVAAQRCRRARRAFIAWHERALCQSRLAAVADANAKWRAAKRAWSRWVRGARMNKAERERAEQAQAVAEERRQAHVATRWRQRVVRSTVFVHWLHAAASLKEERRLREQHNERRRKVLALEQRIATQTTSDAARPGEAGATARDRLATLDTRAAERRARRKHVVSRTEERVRQRRDAEAATKLRREDEAARALEEERAEAEAAKALARQQLIVARLHYDRACLRWRGLVPWQLAVRALRLETRRALRWYADGLVQRTWTTWRANIAARRHQILERRKRQLFDAIRVASRARCRVPLARWVSAARDVAVRGAAVAAKSRRLCLGQRLSSWRDRAAREATKSLALWEDAVRFDARNRARDVLAVWKKKLRLWQQAAFLDDRATAKWAQVRTWMMMAGDHNHTKKKNEGQRAETTSHFIA